MTPPPARSRRGVGAFLRAEIKESFMMAMNALTAHKLRSALTLLGVLVGVFSIIVVMTAVRVLQSNIEKELSQLGSNTFQVRKWPGVYFGGPEGFEKFWRRKNITLAQGHRVMERATLARSVGLESYLSTGEALSRYQETPPNVNLIGGTPGSFPPKAAASPRPMWTAPTMSASWAINSPPCSSLSAPPSGTGSSSMASATPSSVSWRPRATPWAAIKTTSP